MFFGLLSKRVLVEPSALGPHVVVPFTATVRPPRHGGRVALDVRGRITVTAPFGPGGAVARASYAPDPSPAGPPPRPFWFEAHYVLDGRSAEEVPGRTYDDDGFGPVPYGSDEHRRRGIDDGPVRAAARGAVEGLMATCPDLFTLGGLVGAFHRWVSSAGSRMVGALPAGAADAAQVDERMAEWALKVAALAPFHRAKYRLDAGWPRSSYLRVVPSPCVKL